jgi:hypothetical protein
MGRMKKKNLHKTAMVSMTFFFWVFVSYKKNLKVWCVMTEMKTHYWKVKRENCNSGLSTIALLTIPQTSQVALACCTCYFSLLPSQSKHFSNLSSLTAFPSHSGLLWTHCAYSFSCLTICSFVSFFILFVYYLNQIYMLIFRISIIDICGSGMLPTHIVYTD